MQSGGEFLRRIVAHSAPSRFMIARACDDACPRLLGTLIRSEITKGDANLNIGFSVSCMLKTPCNRVQLSMSLRSIRNVADRVRNDGRSQIVPVLSG